MVLTVRPRQSCRRVHSLRQRFLFQVSQAGRGSMDVLVLLIVLPKRCGQNSKILVFSSFSRSSFSIGSPRAFTWRRLLGFTVQPARRVSPSHLTSPAQARPGQPSPAQSSSPACPTHLACFSSPPCPVCPASVAPPALDLSGVHPSSPRSCPPCPGNFHGFFRKLQA